MARHKYPWERLTRIGKRFVVEFAPRASAKDRARLERQIRSAASWQQTRKDNVRYKVSIEHNKETGDPIGVSVERIKVDPAEKIRVE